MASASSTTASNSQQSTQSRRKSNETVCSSNSSCFFNKRKQIHPLAASIRTYIPRNTTTNAVKQRVLSARLLKLRSLQNQLNDANYHLAELQQENRALKNLQNRQDRALSKYEGANADLPRLLKSHEEEMRVIMAKNKTLRKNLKDANDQLKMKEDELASVREQLKILIALSKQKNLGERQMLTDQVEESKEKLRHCDDKINMLNRKLQLETKSYKYKLNAEIMKNKHTQKELLQALGEIDRLSAILEGKPRLQISANNRKRFANASNITRQSVSLISLTDEKPIKETSKLKELEEKIIEQPKVSFIINNEIVFPNEDDNDDNDNQSEPTDLKLDPILNNNEKESRSASLDSSAMPSPVENVKLKEKKVANGIMVSPTENIRARLSASLSNSNDNNIEQVSRNLEKFSLLERENSLPEITPSYSFNNKQKNRPGSSPKLEKLANSADLESLLQKPFERKGEEELNQRFGSLCTDMMGTVKNCNAVVDRHKEDFETAKSETEKLLQNLRQTDSLTAKLRHSNFLETETFEIPDKDRDLVNQIWKDEYNFRKSYVGPKEAVKDCESFTKSDRNGNVVKKEVEVAPEDKSKLLATLRAIDNGEEIEEISYESKVAGRKHKLVGELFGDLHK